MNATKFTQTIKLNFGRVQPETPDDSVKPWYADSVLADFYETLNAARFLPMTLPSHATNDYVLVFCAFHPFRSRHDEQPFLRCLRHPPCAKRETQVDLRLPAVNHGGLVNVKRVRRFLLDKQTHNEMIAMPETPMLYGAACVAFLDKTLSVTALLPRCPKYQNFAMQEKHSSFPSSVSVVHQEPPSTASPFFLVAAAEKSHGHQQRQRRRSSLRIFRPPPEPPAR